MRNNVTLSRNTYGSNRKASVIAESTMGMTIGTVGNGPRVTVSVLNPATAKHYVLAMPLEEFDALAAFVAKNRASYEGN